MKLHYYILAAVGLMQSETLFAQSTNPDSTQTKITLEESVISANKITETKKTVAQQVLVLDKNDIEKAQAQTTADLLASTGSIFVQKSQLGGGSPVIRGFEASRIQLVIDGVKMNNIIYRAGHLQNSITTDNAIFDRMEILYGPSSTIYGSDALGGVIHMYTRKPVFSTDGKLLTKVNAFTRFGSVNNELTGHADINLGGKKLASLTSVTYSSFGDLKGGASQNPLYDTAYGVRPFYVKRINGIDSLVKNDNKYEQIQTAYSQYDIMQKFAFKQNDHITHGVNFQFSNSSDVPRYDRLTDPSGTVLKSAEWYYGPQTRLMAAYDLNITDTAKFFSGIHAGINYQGIEESRHNRNFGSSKLNHRIENVNVMGFNLDLQRVVRQHNFRFGVDGQYNSLKSTANQDNITTGTSVSLDTRYPDGDNTLSNVAIYGSHTMKINDKFTLTDGLRFGFISLHSTFVDTSFFHLPYNKADQSNPVYSGSIGVIHTPNDKLKLSLMVSTGFRAPTVDDLSKVFESAPGALIVPNKDLKPEKTVNTEFGMAKLFSNKTIWEANVYYTMFMDAIVTDRFKYNGADSIMYDGSMSMVLANQNKEQAYIYGFSTSVRSQLSKNFLLTFGLNYTYGRIKTDSTAYPLDHIPPVMVKLMLSYHKDKWDGNFFVDYNSAKELKNYYLNGEDNEQYATKDGMPAWFTANLHLSYKVHKLITLQAGIDNIMDTQYRTFASGINAPGRNIFGAIRFHY